MPKCTIVVFRGHTLPGEQGQLIHPPVNGGPFKTQEEAVQAALDVGSDWFEKNVPTDNYPEKRRDTHSDLVDFMFHD